MKKKIVLTAFSLLFIVAAIFAQNKGVSEAIIEGNTYMKSFNEFKNLDASGNSRQPEPEPEPVEYGGKGYGSRAEEFGGKGYGPKAYATIKGFGFSTRQTNASPIENVTLPYSFAPSEEDIDRAIEYYEKALKLQPSGTWTVPRNPKQGTEYYKPPEGGIQALLEKAKQEKQQWLAVEKPAREARQAELERQQLAQQQQEQARQQQQQAQARQQEEQARRQQEEQARQRAADAEKQRLANVEKERQRVAEQARLRQLKQGRSNNGLNNTTWNHVSNNLILGLVDYTFYFGNGSYKFTASGGVLTIFIGDETGTFFYTGNTVIFTPSDGSDLYYGTIIGNSLSFKDSKFVELLGSTTFTRIQ